MPFRKDFFEVFLFVYVNRLRVKLVRERELRAQQELLSDEDIDKLIGYINAGHTLKGGLGWVSLVRLSTYSA